MNQSPGNGPRVETVPDGDDRARLVCPDCGYIAYDNPKVVTGAVCSWDGRILVCKRAIEPRKGYWTIPAGFLELGETTAEGAVREVWEEARAKITVTGLIGIYEISRISQIYVVHRAEMTEPMFAPGPESEDVALVSFEEIPWEDIAFPSIRWSLEQYRKNTGPIIQCHQE